MAGLPTHYRITSCCAQDVNTGLFKIPSTGVIATGVYEYTDTTFTEPTTGMEFIQGFCYNVENLGTSSTVYPTAFIQAQITFTGTECNTPGCPSCEVAVPIGYQIFSCCDTANVININIDFLGCGGELPNQQYVLNYIGEGFITSSGFVFDKNTCYNIIRIDNGIYETGPTCEDFIVGIGYRVCEDAITDGFCPACDLGLEYLIFTNCCTEETILFKGIDASLYYGVQEYIGIPVDGLVNKCYGIEIGTVGDVTVPDIDAYNALLSPPLYNAGVNFISISNTDTNCETYITQCPSCVIPCYTLYDCDGNYFNTTSDLSAYVGSFVIVSNGEVSLIGSYLVLESSDSNCKNAIDTITVVGLSEPCPIKCYQITGNPTTVTYINSDKELIVQLGGGKVCSYITPIVTGPVIGYVVELGLCVDGVCPDICFEFTNCQTGQVLVVSNSPSIIPYYAEEQIVTLQGYDGCWTIDISEVCDCPVSVTILQSFDGPDCAACLPIVNYKFTNCNNQDIIRYSIEDYSAYVGKTVELECGECWFVSEIDYIPPSTQSIVILYTFDNCTACNRTYYKLTDCLDPTNVTYTYTDLSSLTPTPIAGCECISVTYTLEGEEPVTVEVVGYSLSGGRYRYNPVTIDGEIFTIRYSTLNTEWTLTGQGASGLQATLENTETCPFGTYTIEPGSLFTAFSVAPCSSLPVIKIEGCDTCFTVEETRLPVNAGIVTVTDSYIDCPECLETFPCVCNRITNQDTIAKDFTYLDCLFEEVTINLQPNETSEKVCLINWVLTPEEEALVYIEHFGDCINGQCPVVPLPKRKVKPGYSTPSCDIEKYEKITCRSSEILYKQVMRLRYGLTNCCPEDDEKWLIKKELIDLDALRDPDYICRPVTSCCNQPINDCGCNTLKTCNS